MVVCGLTVVASLLLQASAERHQKGTHSLEMLRTETTMLSQLEWQAVAEQGVSGELMEQVDTARARARAALAQTMAELGPHDGAPVVERELGRYLSLTATEFSLLADGRLEDAEQLDEASVDPTFERLYSLIEEAQAISGGEAERAASLARVATILLPALGLIVIAGLFWRLASTKRAAREAFFDPLTGLANRMLLADRLTQALKLAERTEGRVAVLFLDLDDFKGVNDTLGHTAGDTLLQAIAERLHRSGRASDTVGRLGGDEFALVLQGVADEAGALAAAAKLIALLEAPFRIADRQVTVTASIGCAISDRSGSSCDELLRNADLAMYAGKRQGKRCVVMYEPSMYEALSDRMQLEADLRDALGRSEIAVAYQPIVDVETGRLRSMEALARWTHPVRGVVGPALFIPLAEASGMIHELGRFVLREATQQLRLWQTDRVFVPPIGVNVNVSPVQLQEGRFVDDVHDALRASGIDPSALTLEITESVLVERGDSFASALEALDKLGVHLAVDDFGTGYSSLASLSRFPIDTLKIDRSFVERMHDDGGFELVRSIVDLGRALGLEAVAEGIETPEQVEVLRQLNCDYGQGFHYSYPMTSGEIDLYMAGASSPATPHPRPNRRTDLSPAPPRTTPGAA